MQKRWSVVGIVAAALAMVVASGTPDRLFAAEPPLPAANEPPDLTQGGKRDARHDWPLGPTGLRGWIFRRDADLTAASRQILITAVEAGSPADGVFHTDDVILGVDGEPFADDARKSFGRAITAAEEKTGVLRLIRWRAGTTENVKLTLGVLGKFGDTAPYGCPKSKAIFEQGCRLIAKQGLKDNEIPTVFNALALLASGQEEYRPMVAEFAKMVPSKLVFNPVSSNCWIYAHANLFLAEYVLATGDQTLLPELRRITEESVKMQCMNGMWGHRPPLPDGHSEGYGGMNQVGLPMTMALVLARQAGVDDPAVDKAIDVSVSRLRWYVDKGSIPYGDHMPYASHENNGKCSNAAVLFDLLGDREAVRFFSRMALAAYDEREEGHTGNFWNMAWALPGVSRGGPLATGAYLQEQNWYYELARNWKGGFVYLPIDDAGSYYSEWDLTGAYLLSYGLPLKGLSITGKKPSVLPPLEAPEVRAVIDTERDYFPRNDDNGYYHRTTPELFAGLSSWSPAMRERSARALAKREGDFVPALVKLLGGSDRYGRYGACLALEQLKERADAAAPALRAALQDPDPWLVHHACTAIARLGPQARKDCVIDLLELAARQTPDDPRGMLQRSVGNALFASPPGTRNPTVLNSSLEGVDRPRLHAAMRAMLRNDAGATRGTVCGYLALLSDQDMAVLLPDIVKAIETPAPSDEMFADGIRQAGLDLLTRRHIREGMNLCVSSLEFRHGLQWQKRLECLKLYGTSAKEVLPQLREKRPKWPEGAKAIDACIAEIESSTVTPTLVSMKDFIEKASGESGEKGKGKSQSGKKVKK